MIELSGLFQNHHDSLYHLKTCFRDKVLGLNVIIVRWQIIAKYGSD
jgi:hypothetical protein